MCTTKAGEKRGHDLKETGTEYIGGYGGRERQKGM